jgi:hypothetical protein
MPIIWVAGSLFLGYGDKNDQKFNAAISLISVKDDMLIREYLENCRSLKFKKGRSLCNVHVHREHISFVQNYKILKYNFELG